MSDPVLILWVIVIADLFIGIAMDARNKNNHDDLNKRLDSMKTYFEFKCHDLDKNMRKLL